MKRSIGETLRNCARRIAHRLRPIEWSPQEAPMFSASNIHYEVSTRTRAITTGGIGAIHLMAQRIGLVDEIDKRLHLLKLHKPYHESDHVLNIGYNIACGGKCLEDIELRRNDEIYTEALGAQRIPDPTTAGDFCRRFEPWDVEALQKAFNEARLRVWKQQPEEFFKEAFIDGDGFTAATTGECKEGMDINRKGEWGYHPLLISLANTGEPLFLENRSGNRPSHEGAAKRFDQAVELVHRAGFQMVTLRGDTDFSQTKYLDRWDAQGVQFVFGYDAAPNLVETAEKLPDSAWRALKRKAKYEIKTTFRERPDNIKYRIVRQREFENIRLDSEEVAEFTYSPAACKTTYRVVVVRKNLSREKGERVLFEEVRYFFYITNRWRTPARKVVFLANSRCNQENLVRQLKSGVHAARMPVDNLVSNWAYMVMASLAWSLKAWFALLLPVKGRWKDKHKAEKEAVLRMSFKSFLQTFMQVPAQIVRTGRKIVFRILSWNPWLRVFFRFLDTLHGKALC